MPIHKNADGTYSWGSGKFHGSFESKAAAERQEAAIYMPMAGKAIQQRTRNGQQSVTR